MQEPLLHHSTFLLLAQVQNTRVANSNLAGPLFDQVVVPVRVGEVVQWDRTPFSQLPAWCRGVLQGARPALGASSTVFLDY
jgi:hypothetical protein